MLLCLLAGLTIQIANWNDVRHVIYNPLGFAVAIAKTAIDNNNCTTNKENGGIRNEKHKKIVGQMQQWQGSREVGDNYIFI